VSCYEREVVLFPGHEEWWARELGPRSQHGACVSCYKEAHETDLRECQQCRWPMCKRCWDYYNGRCERCGWIVRDVPKELWPLVQMWMTAPPPGRGRRSARS
jgi:hypothetical protein